MLDLVEMDWLQHNSDDLLHHATLNTAQAHDLEWEARCYERHPHL